jgi:dTDP-glucose 4,6-dehydratase/UDP-glucuronate decarboxylase
MAETLAWTFHRVYQVKVSIVRPFNFYGPGFRLDDKRVLPDFLLSVLTRQPIVMHSDGRPTRSFCYISDAVRGIWRVMFAGKGGEAYNVGNDEAEVSTADLAECVSTIAADLMGGPKCQIIYRASEDPDYLTDNPKRRCPNLIKLRAIAGWTPKVGLSAGLRRTLTYYLPAASSWSRIGSARID